MKSVKRKRISKNLLVTMVNWSGRKTKPLKKIGRKGSQGKITRKAQGRGFERELGECGMKRKR